MPRDPLLSTAKVEKVRVLLAEGMLVVDIARLLKIGTSTVSGIKTGKRHGVKSQAALESAKPLACAFASRKCSPPPLQRDGLCVYHAAREAARKKGNSL